MAHTFQQLCGSKINCDVDTLEQTIQLAVEIAREGREGHKIGTLFVVSDERETLRRSRNLILDPLRKKVREYLMPSFLDTFEIVISPLLDEAGVLGAASVAFENFGR